MYDFSKLFSLSNIKFSTSNMNLWILFIIILFGSLSAIYYYYFVYPNLRNKYKANREIDALDSSNQNTAEFMFYYANWCPYCVKAKPIWEEFKNENEGKTVNGYKLLFIEVDCSDQESAETNRMMDKYKIEGFPTIKLIKDGQIIDFDANVTMDNLNQFLDKMV